MSGLLWGLAASLMIGASDCTARVTSQRVSLLVLIFCVMAISTIALSVLLLVTDQLPQWHTGAWVMSALSGILNIAALLFLYQALFYGPVSIASPTASSFAVILVILNALSGEPWTFYQALAIIIVFIGIVMLTKSDDNKTQGHHTKQWLRRTALLATGAATTIAFRMFFAQEATEALGSVSALYLNRIFALISCAIAIMFMHFYKPTEPMRWPSGKIQWFVLMQGVLEMTAFAAFLKGSEGDGRIAATIGFSTFAAASTLIAWAILKEPIGLKRAMWIGVISLGVVIASVG